MVLICGDPNERALFTWGSQSRIHFTHSSNNSLWACLCSDFNLQALRSCWRTLMFCLNESTVLLDTALQSTDSPPPILSPVINTTSAQKYQNLDHMLRKATFSSPPSSFVNNWGKKIWLLFSTALYLMCVAAFEQATPGWFLLPYSPATNLYVGWPHRAWCLLEPGQRQQPPIPPPHFLSYWNTFLQRIRAR